MATTTTPALITKPLHDGLLCARLIGTISQWTGRLGLIRADGYEDEISFTARQFRGNGNDRPRVGLRVEFVLDKDEKGWNAVICKCATRESELLAKFRARMLPLMSTTADVSPSLSTPASKFPIRYRPERMLNWRLQFLERFTQFFDQLDGKKKPSSTSFVLSSATIYEAKMQEYKTKLEEELFTTYSSSALREDWQRIKEMQRTKPEKDVHVITLEELRTLSTFKPYFRSKECTNTLRDLLHEYSTRVSTSAALPAFAKAAWMFIYFSRIVTDDDALEVEEHAVHLLSNWVLLQHDVPFVVDLIDDHFPKTSLNIKERGRSFLHSDFLHEWLLTTLIDLWSEFDERFSKTVVPPHPLPSLPEKIIEDHRTEMHVTAVCFICCDDTLPCSVSLLCCGQATHSNCLMKWHNTGRGAGACPSCRQPCVEPDATIEEEEEEEEEEGSEGEVVVENEQEEEQEEDDDEEEDEYEHGRMCEHCGERERAFTCTNGCCGLCCGADGFNFTCTRHFDVMVRNSRRWESDRRHVADLCRTCRRRARAQECSNHCCAVCCRRSLNFADCLRHFDT